MDKIPSRSNGSLKTKSQLPNQFIERVADTQQRLSLHTATVHTAAALRSHKTLLSIIPPDITMLFISVVTHIIIVFVLTTALCKMATTPEFLLY